MGVVVADPTGTGTLVVRSGQGCGFDLSASEGTVDDLAEVTLRSLVRTNAPPLPGNVLRLYDGPEVAVNLQDGAVLISVVDAIGLSLRVIDAHAVVVPGAALSFQ